jgi:hypothetical protein
LEEVAVLAGGSFPQGVLLLSGVSISYEKGFAVAKRGGCAVKHAAGQSKRDLEGL